MLLEAIARQAGVTLFGKEPEPAGRPALAQGFRQDPRARRLARAARAASGYEDEVRRKGHPAP